MEEKVLIKSDMIANYDTILVLLEYNISYAVYEEFIDGVIVVKNMKFMPKI